MSLRLVVTGTRHGRPDVSRALDAFVAVYGVPELVIVGDQAGVDTQAHGWGRARGYPVRQVKVLRHLSSPDRYHRRNQDMVDLARSGDHLLAFPIPGSTGTWDCFRRGQLAGLFCVEVTTPWVEVLLARAGGANGK